LFLFDSNVTFTSPTAVCRYLARTAAVISPQTLYYGADILQQAEVCWCKSVFNVVIALDFFTIFVSISVRF